MADSESPDMSGIDPALLQDFISESQEILDGLDPLFVALEASPDDLSIVDGIFRPVHSVKGNSGFFGLTNIKNFAHIMENILGEIRGRKRQATPPLIDILLKGVDFLRGMMNRLAQGDYSGKFLPEEEAHLAILNQNSSAGGDAGGSGETENTPEAQAKELLEAYEQMIQNEEDPALVGRLGDVIKNFIRSTIPGFFENEAAGGGSVTVYRIGTEDVSGYIHTIQTFINELERNEQEETLCEAFLTAIEMLNDAATASGVEAIPPLVEQIKDDFITIHESGIGFDELMTSLIQERFDAILGHVEKIELSDEGDFFLKGENVTDIVKAMQTFVVEIGKAEKDAERSDAFIGGLNMIKDLGGENPNIVHAVEQIQDDYITIHESGIGFDELIQSLMDERLTALLALLDRGKAAQPIYSLGERDVSRQVETLLAFAKSARTAGDNPKTVEGFLHTLQEIAEAAESAGKEEVASAAAAAMSEIDCLAKSEVGFDDNMVKMIQERVDSLIAGMDKTTPEPEIQSAEGSAPADAAHEASSPTPADTQITTAVKEPANGHKPAVGADAASGKTLRIAEEKVDHFMSFVGELIIIGEVFAYIQKKLEQYPEARSVSQEFKNANLTFSELSSNLQKSLMEVRRVPLKSVLQKLHRIIRDTASQLGKKIDLEIVGEDVQIDKSLLEGLESPLVHMVRNSVDHGVEMPEDRVARGKPETGRVIITAHANEEQFSLTIKDDGKGLDLDAIKEKAVSRGILTEEGARTMSDKDAFRLIFNAGLSTAKVVTDVSGRGVGMDVVLSNLTKMNGNILVDSVKGEGSTFTILLPMTVTLTVIDGLVAKIGDQDYIIPLSDVRESVRPKPEQIHTVRGSQEVLNVRGELHPIVHLNRILGIPAINDNPCDATVILVKGKKDRENAAFLVDDIIGQQSVVVKDLGKEFENIKSIQGGSILGDGRVGLVLNVQGILVVIGVAAEET